MIRNVSLAFFLLLAPLTSLGAETETPDTDQKAPISTVDAHPGTDDGPVETKPGCRIRLHPDVDPDLARAFITEIPKVCALTLSE